MRISTFCRRAFWLRLRPALLFALLSVLALPASTSAQNSPHGTLRLECNACHTPESWTMRRDASFKHETTGFALAGQHANVHCASCHEGLKFKKRTSDCLSCHTDIHKSEMGTNCLRCHTQQSWHIPDMLQKHQSSRFPLLGRHSTVDCQVCHTNAGGKQYAGTPTDCYGCHRETFAGTTSPNHVAARFSTDCSQCHQVTAMQWGGGFSHQLSRFPLSGAHNAATCAECHQNNNFNVQYTGCYACHKDDYARTTTPAHAAAGFPTDCVQCHQSSAATWGNGFSHQASRFPLTGAHTSLLCAQCHANNNFQLQYSDCYKCHTTDFAQPANPNHMQGNFSHACDPCHNTNAWKPATFSHASTAFPLTGAHFAVTCAQCHLNGNYQLKYTDCYSCHATAFTQSVNPNHVQGNFSHTCTQCHSTMAWKPATFSHSSTAFQLSGAHASLACAQCHASGNYQLKYTDCYTCHTNDFAHPVNPNHVQGNFSHTCTQCHSTTTWKPSTFSHSSTAFQLTGAHSTVTCAQCHQNGNYQLHYSDCYACHATDFAQPTSPNHAQGNFSHTCTQCHSSTAWKPATFNHSGTKFALTGAHITAACEQCHSGGNYQLQYSDCYACHVSDFAQPVNPNHVQGNYSHSCTDCHSTTAWKPSTFTHSATKFALTGAHTILSCAQCHANGNYQLQYTDCYACHATNFAQPVSPNHLQGNFSHTCTQCHSTTVWKPSTFSHSATAFQLTGAHSTVACEQCHTSGNYLLKYSDCYACHTAAFALPVNPSHVQGNFSHTCTSCHTTTAWKPSTFSHSATKFALTGAHIALQCAQCHANGNYQLQYTDCYACHGTAFTQAVNPNHVQGNFSHTCTDCHSTASWKPATFSHTSTAFPLSGAHQTLTCAQCHVNGNYQLKYTDCYSCHATAFTQSVNPNHVQGNFGHTCTQCHSTTAWKPATFSHANTAFALTGSHTTLACTQCHVNGNYQLQYTDCYACHSAKFAQPTNPNHVLGNFSHTCNSCHTTTVWTPSTFSHSSTAFSLVGAHQAVACNQCHQNNVYQGLPHASCWDCHSGTFNATTNPNHVSGGFSHDCTTCHAQMAWQPATINHSNTKFPLTGAHVPLACAQCHANGNYTLSYQNCYQCHTSDYSGVSNPNHISQQFPKDCTGCHSTSVWNPNTMNHDAGYFRIYSGEHRGRWTQCSQCHNTPGNLGTHNCASSCHRSEHNQGQDCYSCHRNV